MADDVNKRMNYFPLQFLHATDFQVEQAYFLDRHRQHNKHLHTPGIMVGLSVTRLNASNVHVSEGTAVDRQGREIVLTTGEDVNIGAVGSNVTRVELYIAFYEAPSDFVEQVAGTSGMTRKTETHKFFAVPPDSAPPDAVLVATIPISNGKIPQDPPPITPGPMAGASGQPGGGTAAGVTVKDKNDKAFATTTLKFLDGFQVTQAPSDTTVMISLGLSPSQVPNHHPSHEAAHPDQIDVGSLPGLLAEPQKIKVGGTSLTPDATPTTLRFGSGFTVTTPDDGKTVNINTLPATPAGPGRPMSSGIVKFLDVNVLETRISLPIDHGLGAVNVAITLALENVPTPPIGPSVGDLAPYRVFGNLSAFLLAPHVIAAYQSGAPGSTFRIVFSERRLQSVPQDPLTYVVRWWAIATLDPDVPKVTSKPVGVKSAAAKKTRLAVQQEGKKGNKKAAAKSRKTRSTQRKK